MVVVLEARVQHGRGAAPGAAVAVSRHGTQTDNEWVGGNEQEESESP